MRLWRLLRCLVLAVPLLAGPAPAQFTARDLAQRPKWETFLKEAEGLPIQAMAELVEYPLPLPSGALASGAPFEATKTHSARSSRRN